MSPDFSALAPLLPHNRVGCRYEDLQAMKETLAEVIETQNIEAAPRIGRTLLIYSTFLENTQLAQELLKLGANPLSLDKFKFTALDWSFTNGAESPECCALVLEASYQKLWSAYEFSNYNVENRAVLENFLNTTEVELNKHPTYIAAAQTLKFSQDHFNLWHNLPLPQSAMGKKEVKIKI